MPGEIPPPTGQPVSTEAPPITPPATGTPPPPAGTPPPRAAEAQPEGKTVVLPSHAFTRIKSEQREKGKREREAEIAAEFGFSTYEDLKAHFRPGGGAPRTEPNNGERRDNRNRNGRQMRNGNGNGQSPSMHEPVPPAQPQRGADREEWRRFEKARQQYQRDLDTYRRALVQTKNKNRELQRQLDAKDAEMALREVATRVGVKDLDYAVRLITRHLDGKSESDLQGFDEAKFFEGLRTTHPYLFGETVVPANTGTAGAPPAPPKPGATVQAEANKGQFDARDPKVTKEQVNERLRQMGLNPIGV